MKISQTDNLIEVKTSGRLRAIIGVVLTVIGVVLVVYLLASGASPVWMPLIGIVVLIFGGLMAFLAKNRDIVLQRGGTSSISAKRVFWGQSQTQTFESQSYHRSQPFDIFR